MKNLILILLSTYCFSQQTIVASGGNFEQITYSIGQVFYNQTDTVSEGIFSNLTQEPTLSIEDLNKDLSIRAFPNPFINYIQVSINAASYNLYNIKGRLVFKGVIQDKYSRINTGSLEQGIYILQVIKNNSSKSFKIIKN